VVPLKLLRRTRGVDVSSACPWVCDHLRLLHHTPLSGDHRLSGLRTSHVYRLGDEGLGEEAAPEMAEGDGRIGEAGGLRRVE